MSTLRVNTITDAAGTGEADAAQIGVGQTWQNVTASRARNTNYTNSTGRPIFAQYQFTATLTQVGGIVVDGLTVARMQGGDAGGTACCVCAIIPSGSVYSYRDVTGVVSGDIMFELR